MSYKVLTDHSKYCKKKFTIFLHFVILSTVEESVIETGSGALLDPETTLNPPRDSVEIVTQMDETPLSIQTDEDTLIPVAIKVY